jgi:Peptidase A4 family
MRKTLTAIAAVAALAALGATPAFAGGSHPSGHAGRTHPGGQMPGVSLTGKFHIVQLPHGLRREVLPKPQAGAVARSANWSGYVVRPRNGHTFKSVSANFTVAAVNCAKSTDGTSGQSSMSSWVGLDGYGGHDQTVEQTGEFAICQGGRLEDGYMLFWETFPDAAMTPTVCCANPGDAIRVSVTYNSKTHLYHLFLDDYTIASTINVHVACATGSVCKNASAEVIGEDLNGGPPGMKLAFFGQTSFVNASVTSSNGKSGSLNPGKYWKTTEIIMQVGKSVMARPGALEGGRAFLDTWHAGG